MTSFPDLKRRWVTGQQAVRHLQFLCSCAVLLILFHAPLATLASLAFHDARYTSILAIPFIDFGLLWLKRGTIFVDPRFWPGAGAPFVLGGLTFFFIAASLSPANAEYVLAAKILAALVAFAGAFVWCYGMHAAREAMFPLLFLLLIVPIPATILDHIIIALQRGSADVSFWLFKLVGVPVFRESLFKFSLPGVTIEVAEECSGIRSSLSLFISSIAAGYLFLRSGWSRTALSLVTIPIVIFKNAVRIVTISWLGVYIDPGFLYGRLHRYGGLPFSMLALALLAPVFLGLMRAERRPKSGGVRSATPATTTV